MTGTPAKSKSKGKSVSVERKQGDCSPCSFRHDHSKRGASKRSSPISKSQTNNDGMIFKNLRKAGSPEGAVHPGKGSRIRLVCQIYKAQAGCMFGEKCSFLQKETDRQPKKEKGQSPLFGV